MTRTGAGEGGTKLLQEGGESEYVSSDRVGVVIEDEGVRFY